jgi:hypothetical protein
VNSVRQNRRKLKVHGLHEQVKESLLVGKVPPIFHTLVHERENVLFSEISTKVSLEPNEEDCIFLSPATVSAGSSESNNVGTIPSDDDKSYITAFFDNGMARNQVEDLSQAIQWKFSATYTETIASLVNTPAVMIGEDMEITKLKRALHVDRQHGCYLITRRQSRRVVADCFQRSKQSSIHAIVGSPGIGKSWTLIYALQQALLYENVCVLMCFQKTGTAIVCIRRNNKIYVWITYSNTYMDNCNSSLFNNGNVLVLLDPLESNAGVANFAHGLRMFIYSVSAFIMNKR